MSELFDRAAADYDAWYQTGLGGLVDQLEKKLIYSLLEPRPGERALEVGCGTGNYTLELAQRGLKLTGVDLSSGMLERARAKFADSGTSARLIQGDICELEFSPGEFDAILGVTVFEFIPNPRAVIARLADWLRPGGRLVLGMIPAGPWGDFYQRLATADPDSVFRVARFYSPAEIEGFFPDSQVETLTGLYFPPTSQVDEARALENATRPGMGRCREGVSDGHGGPQSEQTEPSRVGGVARDLGSGEGGAPPLIPNQAGFIALKWTKS